MNRTPPKINKYDSDPQSYQATKLILNRTSAGIHFDDSDLNRTLAGPVADFGTMDRFCVFGPEAKAEAAP